MRERRGDFFLSLSLNDFVLTLLFLLLLLSLWSLTKGARDLRAAQDDLESCKESCDLEHVREIEQSVAVIKEILVKAGEDPREVERLVLVALKDAQRLQELEREQRTLVGEKATLQDTIRKLEAKITALVDALPSDRADLAKECAECKEQLAGCTHQMEQCGLGKPPCWADARGKAEYIYTVTIHEEGVSVEPRWSVVRADAAKEIPGALELPGNQLSLAEFKRRAAPVLAWSKQKDCRHYVYIRDEAETKEAFKQQLFGVEDFFYKHVERSTPGAKAAEIVLPD